jgi:2-polyprenyl-3-methyl-5-hydroxy-6-metoxy-1,4-benzoquinol methylase
MGILLKSRSSMLERMDVETLSAESTAEILRKLETINAWLGGVRATLGHLQRFSRHWSSGQRVRIIDWGTGGADIPRAIVRWARPRGFHVDIVGIDRNTTVLEYARKACSDYPEIRLFQEDVNAMNQFQEPFDYAISSLCLHHLSDAEIVDLLKKSDRFSVRGIIMNDLVRSRRAWAWIWVLSRLGRAHPVVQYDGPLSVKRAFTPKELRNLAAQANVSYAGVYKHFGYRLTLAGEKL